MTGKLRLSACFFWVRSRTATPASPAAVAPRSVVTFMSRSLPPPTDRRRVRRTADPQHERVCRDAGCGGVPLALRPRGSLLDVLGGGRGREPPPRGPAHRRPRHGAHWPR